MHTQPWRTGAWSDRRTPCISLLAQKYTWMLVASTCPQLPCSANNGSTMFTPVTIWALQGLSHDQGIRFNKWVIFPFPNHLVAPVSYLIFGGDPVTKFFTSFRIGLTRQVFLLASFDKTLMELASCKGRQPWSQLTRIISDTNTMIFKPCIVTISLSIYLYIIHIALFLSFSGHPGCLSQGFVFVTHKEFLLPAKAFFVALYYDFFPVFVWTPRVSFTKIGCPKQFLFFIPHSVLHFFLRVVRTSLCSFYVCVYSSFICEPP